MSVSDRVSRVAAVVESLEREMELLCVTGVEDRLQDRVRPTLELLRNAGIKVHRTFTNLHCYEIKFPLFISILIIVLPIMCFFMIFRFGC